MFGRHEKRAGGTERRLLVNATLEIDIAQVEQSVTGYLAEPTATSRHSLLLTLERLTALTDQGDAYGLSVIGSAAVGSASKGEVLGETSIDSVVDEVPSEQLNAQLTLVKAAKEEVRGPTAATFASLQAANAALAQVRKHGTSEG
jgi:hypothetical protein